MLSLDRLTPHKQWLEMCNGEGWTKYQRESEHESKRVVLSCFISCSIDSESPHCTNMYKRCSNSKDCQEVPHGCRENGSPR